MEEYREQSITNSTCIVTGGAGFIGSNLTHALANELFKIAGELDIDFYEARKYANHRYCDIHLPSTGVGGHCIPVYPWFLINEIENEDYSLLLKMSQKINDEMVDYWAEKIVSECMKIEKPLNEVKICMKGIAFREGVKSLYNSRNLALANMLEEKGLDVYVYDEMFTEEEIKDLDLNFIKPDDADVVFDSIELEIVK